MKLIVGYGISGKAAEKLLKKKGFETLIFDENQKDVAHISQIDQIPWNLIDQVIVSPGIPIDHPALAQAKEKKIEVIGEIELALREIKNPVLAITGTNGKTTTVSLTTFILNSVGKKARALGNIGNPISEALETLEQDEIIILELSSFQLETMNTKAIDLAVLLNISENHLDRHQTMEAYVKAKANIENCLKGGGEFFVFEEILKEYACFFKAPKTVEKELAPNLMLNYIQLEMPSKQSVQTAYLLCKRCGVSAPEFLSTLEKYKKPEHRIEWVAKIDGVSYYNDSKSSNVASVIHAVDKMERQVILIVGGVHKGSSYKPWIEKFEGKVKMMIAYGKAAPIIEFELGKHFDLRRIDRFEDAVNFAKQIAKEGEVVLLSPGCSSFDQFKNYERRGEEFKRLVRGVS